ncbi:MAG: glutamyl-tRNA reductase, partial [Bacteroidia bacterium]|nr:glutamyl-tRNA reductase [Bacteroidia bacterium]
MDIRECIALGDNLARLLLLKLRSFENISDILVLSTCNRTEIYYASPIDYFDQIVSEILSLRGLAHEPTFKPYFQAINDHHEAVTHLFEVAMGLDSQVVGDM